MYGNVMWYSLRDSLCISVIVICNKRTLNQYGMQNRKKSYHVYSSRGYTCLLLFSSLSVSASVTFSDCLQTGCDG